MNKLNLSLNNELNHTVEYSHIMKGTDIPITGLSACHYYGLCSGNIRTIVLEMDSFKEKVRRIPNNTIIVNTGFKDEYTYDKIQDLTYVSKFKAVYDLAYSYSDEQDIVDALESLEDEGELETFYQYATEHKMDKEVLEDIKSWYEQSEEW